MEDACRVSIILPVQGSDEALDRAVSGVLAQSETRWRLWLVESAGGHGRAARWVGRDDRVRVVQDECEGRAAALRAGLAQCRGTYTALLDTEHCWEPGFLAVTTGFLASLPLMDLVCVQDCASWAAGQDAMLRSIYRERAALCEVLDPAEVSGSRAALDGVTWYCGELSQQLGRGEYTRLAVTLLTTTAVEWLKPALNRDSAALEYRLQACLAQAFEVNLLALPGAVRRPVVASPQAWLQQEVDALAVFDDVHGRQHEADPELARLREERLRRIRRGQAALGSSGDSGLGRLMARVRALWRRSAVVPVVMTMHSGMQAEN